MNYLPPFVSDVNESPRRLDQNTVLDVWLTSGSVGHLFDPNAFSERLFEKYKDRKFKPVRLLGYNGYIGRNIRAVLDLMGIATYYAYDLGKTTGTVLIHLACPRKSKWGAHPDAHAKWVKRALAHSSSELSPYEDWSDVMYFSSQCIFNEPADDVYSIVKQDLTDDFVAHGAKIFVPGTVFGSFVPDFRTDTVLNKIALRHARDMSTFATAARRSFITIHDVIEAVVRHSAGLDFEDFQSYNIGREVICKLTTHLGDMENLWETTGRSLANFYPRMTDHRSAIYRRYLAEFTNHIKEAKWDEN